jgi:hypothetical protein
MTTTYEVEVVKTAVTIPSPAGNQYPGTDDYLFSAVQNVQYTIDLEINLFEVTEDPPVEEGGEPVITTTQLPVTDVQATSTVNNVQFTVLDDDPYAYTIRIVATLVNILPGETYTVVLPTNDPTQGFPTSIVSVGSLPAYVAIVRWTPPSVFSTLLTNAYSFTVNPEVEDITYNMNQYVYWDLDSALASFQTALAAGL